jgi:hypothetical protein
MLEDFLMILRHYMIKLNNGDVKHTYILIRKSNATLIDDCSTSLTVLVKYFPLASLLTDRPIPCNCNINVLRNLR